MQKLFLEKRYQAKNYAVLTAQLSKIFFDHLDFGSYHFICIMLWNIMTIMEYHRTS